MPCSWPKPKSTISGTQFAVGGPIGDTWGAAARERLKELAAAHPGRVWNGAGQYVSGAAKDCLVLAADFCLCPSRFEPCGLVDIEFGWQARRIMGWTGQQKAGSTSAAGSVCALPKHLPDKSQEKVPVRIVPF